MVFESLTNEELELLVKWLKWDNRSYAAISGQEMNTKLSKLITILEDEQAQRS